MAQIPPDRNLAGPSAPNQEREPVYAARKKQACSRCHTKRIKCLGGPPCRNCALSSLPCIFPLSRKHRSTSIQHATVQFTGVAPDERLLGAGPSNLQSATASFWIESYRRPEKDFTSSRSSQSQYGRRKRPNYRGNPTDETFVEQSVAWMAEQRSELLKRDDISFNPSWASLGPSSFDLVDSGLEISIDTVLSRPTLPSRNSKPVKIRLPPYNHSTYLIQVLETAIGDQQHYFRRRDIRAKLARMHQSPDSAQSKDQGWLCHWLSIVALGELYSVNMQSQLDPHNSLASEKAVGAGVHESPGMEYYQQSVSLLQQVAENPDIQYIETLCLLALYAFSINRINTAYMYVGVCMRAALSLDLHRHPQDFPSERSTLPAVELEHQKRLFWTVYYQDLLATSTTGRPWGVLDDEITVDYADSSRLSAEEMLEFFDDQESNIHLELMRLRSQAYSSLYGYAGTAINPYSNISLFDFNLGDCLTQQHLDKIHEFNRALNTWEADLPIAMRIARSWDGSMMNINRINANMYLIYHQSILVIVRPALFNAYSLLCNSQSIPVISHEANRTKAQPTIPAHVLQVFFMSSMSSARETASILQWLRDQGCLPTYSYFVASFSFTATIALYVARALHFAVFHDPYLMSQFPFEQNDHAALETVVQLLNQQASAGNLPAIEFARLSRLLDNNLQALQSAIHTAVNFGDVDLNFLTPEILLSEGDNG